MTTHQDSTAPRPDIIAGEMATFFEGHHRGLRAHLTRLASATAQPLVSGAESRAQWKVEVMAGVAALRGFAEMHFADEEKLMEDVAYPGAADHAREHRAFLAWLERIDALIETDGARLREEATAQALVTWWETHATDHDASLADFLCRGGV